MCASATFCVHQIHYEHIALRLRAIQKYGLIRREDVPALRALYAVNPLLCDFVVKRLMRSPGEGNSFDARIFTRFHDMINRAAPQASGGAGAAGGDVAAASSGAVAAAPGGVSVI